MKLSRCARVSKAKIHRGKALVVAAHLREDDHDGRENREMS